VQYGENTPNPSCYVPRVLPPDVQALAREINPESIERIAHPELGLVAYVVVDSTVLGPAAGGARLARYADERSAALDACRLARAMTYKCALGGVDAGGGKIVVMDGPGLAREQAYAELGKVVEARQGDLRTAGDLGTTDEDLATMARYTRYVHTDTANLSEAVARGVVRCAEACADMKGRPGLSGMRAAVQGCGDIGAAVAEAMIEAGASVRVADLDGHKARALADRIGATVVSPNDVLFEDVDLIAPCAVGDVITAENVSSLRAWAVCGAANNICADHRAHAELHKRRLLFVPDLISSAGAVIEGIGRTVMGLDDRTSIIDALRHTALLVLEDAKRSGTPPIDHAVRRAQQRLADASR
jgi:leucine dehydrogenase